MNVLAIVAHPDDEIIGCGATLRRLANAGHRVYSCVLSASADARHDRPDLDRLRRISVESARMVGIEDSVHLEFKNIQFNTVPHLDMVRAIEGAITRFRPEWIFTHFPGDLNIDHRVCYEAAASAVMLPQRLSRDLPVTLIKRVYLFEIQSSTDWSLAPNETFRPNSFFDVTDTFTTKVEALRHFEGALKPYPHSRSEENITALARVRGGAVGIEMAEAFMLVRDVNIQTGSREEAGF
jgi:LmbE family N-acetylglucosaminyl deacetylase